MPSITINQRKIAKEEPPYIIAEMSANHNGEISKALELIKKAKYMGADAIKLQTYTPDTITLQSERDDFKITEGLWQGQTLYDLYQSAHTPWEWHKTLFDTARDIGLTAFSSPFDKTAIDFLEDLNVPAYKIASFEAIDLPLIRYAASTTKPVIISTGMASLKEIEEAVDIAQQSGCRELALLHCVSAYPAAASDYNLATISDIAKRFNVVVGLSDHTLGNTTAITSVALGAAIVEKHFTLNRNGGGPDDSFSMEPEDLERLCIDSHTAWQALGEVNYHALQSERGNIQFRRSLYVVEEIKENEIISENNVKSIRPGFGLPPKYLDQVIGKKVTKTLLPGMPLTQNDLLDSEL